VAVAAFAAFFDHLLEKGVNSEAHSSITARTKIIEPRAKTLELPLLVWSSTFLFFCLELGLDQFFRSGFPPLSKRGNFGRLSTRFNYFKFLRYSSF